jgi:hypothetical protein
MQIIRHTCVAAAIVTTLSLLLVPTGASAQSTASGSDQSTSAGVSALAEVKANRATVIREVMERWRPQFRPFDAVQNTGGDEERFAAALETASLEKLLAASQAQTYGEALATVLGRWQGPSVIPLEPGAAIINALGDTTADLVFTPVTPCRIIDTRYATDPTKLGRIGPDDGKQFSVSLTNYATQGGNAGTCNIPVAPAGVAINVTSTDQTGTGNLRVIQTGGGIPNVSLLNYTAGTNLANAAIARSSGSLGGNNIFIYSKNAASQVVVDIMGYFAAPEATAVENVKETSSYITIANNAVDTVTSPVCPSGYTITGGGGGFTTSIAGAITMFLHPYGTTGSPFTQYNCGGWNVSGGSLTFVCISVCSRVPGR